MNFTSPSRPRLGNGLPSFLTSPNVALPRLGLTPLPSDKWRIEVIINCSYNTLVVASNHLSETLAAWADSPEAFILEKFNLIASEAPQAFYFSGSDKSGANPEEFGL